MAVTVNRLRMDDVQPPPFLGAMTPQEWFHHLQILPFWVRTGGGDGAILKDQANQTVLDKSGQPIMVMFSAPPTADWAASVGIPQVARAMRR